MASKSGTRLGCRYRGPIGSTGEAMPRAMVVTLTPAVPLPLGSMFGLTAQVVSVAATGSEQDKLTCKAKPFWAVTVIALLNVAVCPALTVCVVVPVALMEKWGGRENVKFKTPLPAKATGWGSRGAERANHNVVGGPTGETHILQFGYNDAVRAHRSDVAGQGSEAAG